MRDAASPPRPEAESVPRPRANYSSRCAVYKKRTAVWGRASRTAVGGESENRENFYFAVFGPRYQTNRFLLTENLSENPKIPLFFRSHPFRSGFLLSPIYMRANRESFRNQEKSSSTPFSLHLPVLPFWQPPTHPRSVLAFHHPASLPQVQYHKSLIYLSLRHRRPDLPMAHRLLIEPPTPPCAGSGVLL